MYMQTMIPQAENVLGGTFVRPVESRLLISYLVHISIYMFLEVFFSRPNYT